MGRIRGILLAILGSLGLGLILYRLWGLHPINLWPLVAAAALGSLAGAISTGRSQKVALSLAIVSGICSGALGIWWFGGFLKPMMTLGIYLITLGALTASGYGFYGPLGIWSTIVCGISVFAANSYGGYFSLAPALSAIFALLLTVDGFRDISMRKSQHKNRSYQNIGNPGGIQQHSAILVLLFLVIAAAAALVLWGFFPLFMAGIKALFHQGTRLYDAYMEWLGPIVDAFQAWLKSVLHNRSGDGGIRTEDDREGYTFSPGLAVAVSRLIMVACIIGMGLVIIMVVGGLFVHSRRKVKKGNEIVDYEDFIEKLEHPSLFHRLRSNLRKQRLRDFEDPAMKIRFVFQQLLRKKSREDGQAILKTPNELLDSDIPDEEMVISAYNRVRYGNRDVSNEELAAAERYLKNL